MNVIALPATGNSSKFQVTTKDSTFKLALSYTLRSKIWKLADPQEELQAAQELAEAIVSRHDPTQPFKDLYIFAEHNTFSMLAPTVQEIRKDGY